MSTQRWFVVTNTENLEFFLNYGLIVDQQGFRNNAYIADAMQNRPNGYIPCFAKDNVSEALTAATEEDRHLKVCLIEIEVKKIRFALGFARMDTMPSQAYIELTSTQLLDDSSSAFSEILLPAPLPISCVKSIILEDSETQKNIEHHYKSSFGIGENKLVCINKKLFKSPKNSRRSTDQSLLTSADEAQASSRQVAPRELNYQNAYAYGGALSTLYYQTKNGRHSTQLFNQFADHSQDAAASSANMASLMAALFNELESTDETAQLYKSIIGCLMSKKDIGEARYSLLALLKDQNALPPSYARDCPGLATSLTQLSERTHPDDTDTIFKKLIEHYEAREPGRSKIFLLLTMFFVRDNTETMLKYYHDIFTEEDYALLAIFFGAINSFVNTPSIIRLINGLSLWISFKMAQYMHRQVQGDAVSFFEPSKPFIVYGTCFKASSANYKLHDFYEKFCELYDMPESEFINWASSDEMSFRNKRMECRRRPKWTAELDFELLEKVMQQKTIVNSVELFDFNALIAAYQKCIK